jgi:hypothetical protein
MLGTREEDGLICPFLRCDACGEQIEQSPLGMVSWDDSGRAIFLHKRCGQLVTPWEELDVFLEQLSCNVGHVRTRISRRSRTILVPQWD